MPAFGLTIFATWLHSNVRSRSVWGSNCAKFFRTYSAPPDSFRGPLLCEVARPKHKSENIQTEFAFKTVAVSSLGS